MIHNQYPVARVGGIVITEHGTDLSVYDLDRHDIHILNEQMTRLFRWSDGQTSVCEMAQRLAVLSGTQAPEEEVVNALDRLASAHLVTGWTTRPKVSRLARRRLGGLAIGATIASISAPVAADSTSGDASACTNQAVDNSSECYGCCNAHNIPGTGHSTLFANELACYNPIRAANPEEMNVTRC